MGNRVERRLEESSRLPEDFRLLLQDELAERCKHNPRYSLRAFAQSLGIGSSDLSKFIRRRRQLSQATLDRLSKKLGLDPAQTEKYREALLRATKLNKVSAREGAQGQGEYRQLSLDTFRSIADWYHFAILELIKVRGFKPDPRWIAQRLGLTVSEVNIAVQRLIRLEFLEVTAKGKWRDKVGSTTSVNNEYTDVAKRLLQRQILEKAIEALDEVPFEQRAQSAILMAINSERLPEAKILIRDFRRQLSALLEKGAKKDQIYYLNVSLFPVLKPSGEDHEES